MSTFKVKQRELNIKYEYENELVTVAGSMAMDQSTGQVKTIGGSITKRGVGYLCNFTGTIRGSEIHYSVTDVTQQDAASVWTAIGDIEACATTGGTGAETASEKGGEA